MPLRSVKQRPRVPAPAGGQIPWVDDWKQRIFQDISKRFGVRVAIGCIAIFVVIVPLFWANRTVLLESRGWNWVQDRIRQPILPIAASQFYTVGVLSIDGDYAGEYRNFVEEALREIDFIETISIRRSLDLPTIDDEIAIGKAVQFLDETKSDILLVGRLIKVGNHIVPKLFWVTKYKGVRPLVGRYAPDGSNLPSKEFFSDLGDSVQISAVADLVKAMNVKDASTLRELVSRTDTLKNAAQSTGRPIYLAIGALTQFKLAELNEDLVGATAAVKALVAARDVFETTSSQAIYITRLICEQKIDLYALGGDFDILKSAENDCRAGLNDAIGLGDKTSEHEMEEALANAIREVWLHSNDTDKFAESIGIRRRILARQDPSKDLMAWVNAKYQVAFDLESYYDRTSDEAAKKEVISICKDLINNIPKMAANTRVHQIWNVLAVLLMDSSDLSEANEAIEAARNTYSTAVKENLPARKLEAYESNIALALLNKARITENPEDLNAAVKMLRAISTKLPLGTRGCACAQLNLAHAIVTYVSITKEVAPLSEARAILSEGKKVYTKQIDPLHYSKIQLLEAHTFIVEWNITRNKRARASAISLLEDEKANGGLSKGNSQALAELKKKL